MWVTILLQALMFVISNAPELIAAVQALFGFFKAHRANPNLNSWMSEFPGVLRACEAAKDPRPLLDFLAKLRDQVKGT